MLEEVGWLPAGQMPSRRRLPSSSRRSLDDHPYVGSTSCPMFALGHIIMQRLCPSITEDNHKHPLIAHSHQRRDVVEYVEGSTVVLVQELLRELFHVHTAMWTMAKLLIDIGMPRLQFSDVIPIQLLLPFSEGAVAQGWIKPMHALASLQDVAKDLALHWATDLLPRIVCCAGLRALGPGIVRSSCRIVLWLFLHP